MAEAYIVAAARTAGGKRKGRLSSWHPVDLAAEMLDAVVDRAGIDPALVEDVIMGCVLQAGEQAGNIARHAVLVSKLPISVPGTSVDRQCGSSQQAMHFAAAAVMSGQMDVVIAAGVESMSRFPVPTAPPPTAATTNSSKSPRFIARWGESISQFRGAELLTAKHGFTRADLDDFAFESHRRAIRATQGGAFAAEIVPIVRGLPEGGTEIHTVDEGIRFDVTPEGISSVKLLAEGGAITAATSSQICDGAAAVMIASAKAVKDYGLKPLARFHQLTVSAGDPDIMLEEPLFATAKALARCGMKIEAIDLYEVNEAFAPVPLAWLKYTGADPERLNVNGGAIALGHPLGASGTKLMTTLIYALHSRNKRFGLQTMCEAGGMANVAIIEAL
jgi:acetyl-CoA C-acetyltransferase